MANNSDRGYYLGISMWKEDDPGNNRSLGHVRVYLYSTYQYFSNWIGEAYLDVNGGRAQYKYERFYMSGTNSSIEVLQWDGWIGHDVNGNGSFYAYAYFNIPNGASYTPRGLWADASIGLQNYDRSPVTPSITNVARSSTGEGLTAFDFSGGVNNGGPAVSYQQRVSVNSNMSGFSTFSGTSVSLDPTTAYYFQVYAANSDGEKYSSVYGPVYGVPSPPINFGAAQNPTNSGNLNLVWGQPSNTQGNIQGYRIYVSDTYIGETTSLSATINKINESGTALTVGNNYNLYVVARNQVGFNLNQKTPIITLKAPGAPAAPVIPATQTINSSSVSNPFKSGRNVTISCNATPDSFGIDPVLSNANQGYFIQYQTSATQNGTYSAWSTPVKMSDQNNRTHTFVLLPPALWYKFRIYAANTIVNNKDGAKTYYPNNSGSTANFSVETAAMFVSAGGRRYRSPGEVNENTWQPTETAKRYDSSTGWTDLNIAKRWDSTANGGSGGWIDLT